MSQDNKKRYFIQDTILCVIICAPLVFAGYAASQWGYGWFALAVAWTALLFLFFTYCPDDEDE